MILKLKPQFFKKVWGGNKLKNVYNYDCSDKTGEAWGISGHKNGSSTILNGIYKGKTLRELYNSNRELFGNYKTDEFPILIKIIDAMDDLSIQVHPGDDYARKYEDSLGKTECWYILDADKDTNIIIGHKTKTIDEFKKFVADNDFESVLNKFPINKEDTFYIYSGTIHAICKGTLLLEIQQSSDVTYRLYDYNRLSEGKLRDLHLDKALDVIKFPDNELATEKPIDLFDFYTELNESNTNKIADIYGDYIFILEGLGTFNDLKVSKGDFIFVTTKSQYLVKGNLKCFIGNIK